MMLALAFFRITDFPFPFFAFASPCKSFLPFLMRVILNRRRVCRRVGSNVRWCIGRYWKIRSVEEAFCLLVRRTRECGVNGAGRLVKVNHVPGN